MHTLPKRWVIIGSDYQAWLTAFFLQKKLIAPLKKTGAALPKIFIVDTQSSAKKILCTSSALRDFNKEYGITESHFVRKCQACFNLGTEYRQNTRAHNTAFFLGESPYGCNIEGLRFHHIFQEYQHQGGQARFDEFSLAAQMAKQCRFTPPASEAQSIFSTIKYGYRFSSFHFRDYLAGLLDASIEVYREAITQVKFDSKGLAIQTISLKSGKQIEGDWFIDLSPTRMVHQLLEAPHQKPASPSPTVTATLKPMAKSEPLQPYQQLHLSPGKLLLSSSCSAGTQVLAISDTTSKDNNWDTAKHAISPWQGNCIAMGNAIESGLPLVIDEVHMLIRQLKALSTLWPRTAINSQSIGKPLIDGLQITSTNQSAAFWFNRYCTEDFANLRDIESLYYEAAFSNNNTPLSATAREKVNLYCETGALLPSENTLVSDEHWIALIHALSFKVSFTHHLARNIKGGPIIHTLDNLRNTLQTAAASAPTLQAFMHRFQLVTL